jgi:hypothetical protein
LRVESRGFEADGADEGIEIVDDTLVQAIELRPPLGLEPGSGSRPEGSKRTTTPEGDYSALAPRTIERGRGL